MYTKFDIYFFIQNDNKQNVKVSIEIIIIGCLTPH